MNRLNLTESAVFKHCRFSRFLKDLLLFIISRMHRLICAVLCSPTTMAQPFLPRNFKIAIERNIVTVDSRLWLPAFLCQEFKYQISVGEGGR